VYTVAIYVYLLRGIDMVFVVAAIWIGFLVLLAVIGRVITVKWAEKRGWSALTMPMVYHVWFITAYLTIVVGSWMTLELLLI
jgi:hypothetical protein